MDGAPRQKEALERDLEEIRRGTTVHRVEGEVIFLESGLQDIAFFG